MTATVVHKNPICSFNANWIAPVVNQYLQFQPWDFEKTYDPGTLFYLNLSDFCTEQDHVFCAELVDRGFRVIIDNLWECDPGPVPNTHRIVSDRWFWYNESLWYQYLGYDQYQPQRDFRYRALMPMNRRRTHRDDWISRVDCTGLLWSYVEAGRQLPDDGDMSDWNTQRLMNPAWYNQSYANIVVESLVRPGSRYTPCFITEKTMKPLAFQQPFVVYGNRNVLATLRSWGFETWSNLWDESYDQIVDHQQRRDAVIDIVNALTPQAHSTETLQKLQHNRNHFFDTDLVRRGFVKDVLEPILEYAQQ